MTPPEKDWFSDGKEAARKLKLDLGIDTRKDVIEGHPESADGVLEKDSRYLALESGRAAARALLEQMNTDNELDEGTVNTSISMSRNEDSTVKKTSDDRDEPSRRDHFDFPSNKSHCMTICMVPPSTAYSAWSQLTSARKACRDPGFYRWPPHVNLLYPFLEPLFHIDGTLERASAEEKKQEVRVQFMNEVTKHLSNAAKQCRPFHVNLDSFGCFGGKSRGVLWADPKSTYSSMESSAEKVDPLIHLQNMLEKEFPMCNDQRKQGSFTPHMTISHYANISDAIEAKDELQSSWEPVSFHVSEVYLLQRTGDDGQFKVAATIPLGPSSIVKIHDPPISFPGMPIVEEEWVRLERMLMKNRRKKSFKGKRRKRVE
ncbi:hypothetical protein HJC23_003430 [Cyclotella cryptica]|uniref:Uncharacterized protein n=1 Tax=Cyclotella cryptica TaxID=29204 RepID=A0ABD3QRY5_9STRA